MNAKEYNVLELFSGIGGMHLALKELGINYKIVAAMEINDMANRIYRHNFPSTNLMQKNIEGITVKQIQKLDPNMILMSPPCQPFTRAGLKQDVEDKRCMPLLHLLKLLPELTSVQYILLENVVGFEKSEARDQLVETLRSAGFKVQEYHLCPSQFNIPNKRPRYYLLAKRPGEAADFLQTGLQSQFPVDVLKDGDLLSQVHKKVLEKTEDAGKCFKIKEILEENPTSNNYLTFKHLKFFMEFDLVGKESRLSGCFTKSYKRYFLGTGSIFLEKFDGLSEIDTSQPDYHTTLTDKLAPRFFTTREILRLMCFPEWYKMPSEVTEKQAAAVLGNSINVHVVALLIGLLIN
ncbi:tRNA (cytosine(38)-C(5))-methyltransferase [Neocloeon triangulifer]|uniref:tRNA (cytosine(38)-C(5))-methyltransferase n=1 Tax=Neocloeon triangulifer TaxID=2078957 RepID=UPI00286ED929|nr:tRNA (cytosine(38)-C(5))-methyltransferase [Neocloeon triangulifer]